MDSTRTSRTSPGTAPSTWIGPVITCTPGPRVAIGMASYTARTPSSIMRSGASPAWCVSVSMRTRSPERTRSTGGSAASKTPQKQVAGVARSSWIMAGSSELHQARHDERDPRHEGDEQQPHEQHDHVRHVGAGGALHAGATERARDEEPDAEGRDEEAEPEGGHHEDAVVQRIDAEARDDREEHRH